jgi:transcriptional regulator with XRE-family HTH domain
MEDVADKLDVSTSYISKLENGSKVPNLEIIEKYAKEFNIRPSVIYLFADKLDNDNTLLQNFSSAIMKLMRIIEKWGEI